MAEWCRTVEARRARLHLEACNHRLSKQATLVLLQVMMFDLPYG